MQSFSVGLDENRVTGSRFTEYQIRLYVVKHYLPGKPGKPGLISNICSFPAKHNFSISFIY